MLINIVFERDFGQNIESWTERLVKLYGSRGYLILKKSIL